MIDINSIQEKLDKVLKTMANGELKEEFKHGNINSLIACSSQSIDSGDYDEAVSALTSALEELNKCAIDLMQSTSKKIVENRYEKKD